MAARKTMKRRNYKRKQSRRNYKRNRSASFGAMKKACFMNGKKVNCNNSFFKKMENMPFLKPFF
jgi:hypothetical protein